MRPLLLLPLSHRRLLLLLSLSLASLLLALSFLLVPHLFPPPPPPPPYRPAELYPPTQCPAEVQVRRDVRVPRNVQDVRAVIARTKGIFVRDWSLWLGWNNMKYIMETALNHATLLNRTLVLPSFVYARDCEFDHSVCSAFATLVNRTESGSSEWIGLGEDEDGWRIPIEVMLDLPYLLASRPVILTSELLLLSRLPALREPTNGQFDPSLLPSDFSLHAIPPGTYDPAGTIRVDSLPPPPPPSFANEVWRRQKGRGAAEKEVGKMFDGRKELAWSTVRSRLRKAGVPYEMVEDDWDLVRLARALGLEPVWQYEGRKLDMTRSVSRPYTAFVPRPFLRGFKDDFASITADALYLPGEIHAGRRPGSMFFSSPAARDRYTMLVLGVGGVKVPPEVEVVAERVAGRMSGRVGGRMWMAGHMRRGDFERLSWTLAADFSKHLERVARSLAAGREVLRLRQMSNWTDVILSPSVPFTTPYLGWAGSSFPLPTDPFYLATDTHNTTQLAIIRSSQAVLLADLFMPEDRRLLGDKACLTDVLGLVEKEVMVRAAYWVGQAGTSVSGGVANGRAGWGMDVRCTVLEL